MMAWTRAEPRMDAKMRAAIEELLLATQELRAGDYPEALQPVVDAVNAIAVTYLRPAEPSVADRDHANPYPGP